MTVERRLSRVLLTMVACVGGYCVAGANRSSRRQRRAFVGDCERCGGGHSDNMTNKAITLEGLISQGLYLK